MAHTAHKTLAHHRAHRAAHEVKFKCGDDDGLLKNCARLHHQGFGFTRVFDRFGQAVGVFAAVFEFQTINRFDFLRQLNAVVRIQ